MKKFFTTFLIAIFLAGGVCTVFGNQAYAMETDNSSMVVVHHNASSADTPDKVECCDCDEWGDTEMKCCSQKGNNTIVSHSTDHQIRKSKFKSKTFVNVPPVLTQKINEIVPKAISTPKENYLPKRVNQRIVRLE